MTTNEMLNALAAICGGGFVGGGVIIAAEESEAIADFIRAAAMLREALTVSLNVSSAGYGEAVHVLDNAKALAAIQAFDNLIKGDKI